MMLGIRSSQQHCLNYTKNRKKISKIDFNFSLKWKFPKLSTIPEEYTFFDYCPFVFKKIREYFNISEDEYMLSFSLEQILGN
jgi:hypothetical protein